MAEATRVSGCEAVARPGLFAPRYREFAGGAFVSTKKTTARRLGANELMDAFLTELSTLSKAATAVVKLRRESIIKGLAELEGSAGQSPAKVLHLMDQIEASLLIIRRKLLP